MAKIVRNEGPRVLFRGMGTLLRSPSFCGLALCPLDLLPHFRLLEGTSCGSLACAMLRIEVSISLRLACDAPHGLAHLNPRERERCLVYIRS